MKNSSRGWPSSPNRNAGFEKAAKSWRSLFEELRLKFWKYGAELESAMMSAG